MAGTQVTSPNQVTRYERKNISQIIGFISVLILIFAYKLGIDSIEYIPFYNIIRNNFFFFISPLKIQLKKDTNLQNSVPPKAGKDTESSSPHFEWHLQIFNYIVLKVQTSLAPNNAKNKLCFSFEKTKKKKILFFFSFLFFCFSG